MPNSRAFSQFMKSLTMAEELLKIERDNYDNPPRNAQQKAVQGLRGGAVVLMVAAFENFLRQAFEEHLTVLTIHPVVPFDNLPEQMQINSMYFTLERAMKGPPYQKPPPKKERLFDIDRACRMLVYQSVNPSVFCDTGSNPNSRTINLMFSNVGIHDVLAIIKDNFENEWRSTVAHSFIQDKLDEIINRRHVVAHTADALNLTRSDLNEFIKFLKLVAKLLDLELKRHIETIRRK